MYWEDYRLEVWGENISGPPLCELRMFSIPQQAVEATSPARFFLQPTNSSPSPTTYTSHLNSPRSGRESLPAPLSSLSQQAAGSPFVQLGVGIGGRISPPVNMFASSPSMYSLGGPLGGAQQQAQQQLFLAEFVRGQLDIFAFKRWYTVSSMQLPTAFSLSIPLLRISDVFNLIIPTPFLYTVSGFVFVCPKSSNEITPSKASRLGPRRWWTLDFFNVTTIITTHEH